MEVSPLRQAQRDKNSARKTEKGRRVKLSPTWNPIKKLGCASSTSIQIHQEVAMKPLPISKPKKRQASHSTKSLAYFLQVPHRASDFIDHGKHMTPTKSPKENLSKNWRQIHGSSNWESLLDPLHPSLRREIVKYGDFVQATYDAFDFDPLSEYCGSCRYNRHKLFQEVGLTKHGYKVTKYIYAMSHVDVPSWFERSQLGTTWSKDSNWMGYVAVSNDEESARIGRRDIVVAWRGTIVPTEWFMDLKTKLQHIGGGNVKVQHGFHSIYTSKKESTRYNKLSASEQAMEEVKRLVKFYRENGHGDQKEVSLTVTGHSLGGALALLNAYEAATSIPGLFTSVISFGTPRVGNLAFRNKLTDLGVKILRVVVKQDVVPKLPGIVFNKILHRLNPITKRLNWVYRHVGTKLELDMLKSPYLKPESDLLGSHNLEIYLHLLDGFLSKKLKFRWNARRDVVLVNKSSGMLIEELKIPESWYEMPHKGLVLNKYGRWVKPSREPEDVPSPLGEPSNHPDLQF